MRNSGEPDDRERPKVASPERRSVAADVGPGRGSEDGDVHMTMTPAQRAIYERLLAAAKAAGPFKEDPKKTSIHLARTSAFAGVATRKGALLLTIKAAADIASPRIVKREQVSAHRWHLEVRLEKPSDVDRELEAWLKDAMALSSSQAEPR